MPPEPTLYEWAGGSDGFERWLNAFYDLVEDDDLLAPMFGGKVTEEHRTNVVAWWAEELGPGRGGGAVRTGACWGWGVAPPYRP